MGKTINHPKRGKFERVIPPIDGFNCIVLPTVMVFSTKK